MRPLLALLIALLLAVGTPFAFAGYVFDGVNDQISWGDIPTISDATTLSCSAWVYNDNLTQDHYIFGNSPGGNGFRMFTDDVASVSGRTDTYNIFVSDSGGANARVEGATGAALATTWQNVVFTFVALTAVNGLHLYIDGVEDANSPVATTSVDNVGNSNNNVMTGTAPDSTLDRAGRVAELACWNRVLSAAEAAALAKVAPSCLPTGLLFYAPLRGMAYGSTGFQAGTAAHQAAGLASHPAIVDCPGGQQ